MTTNELATVVLALAIVFGWGTWLLWRGNPDNRTAGLVFTWMAVAVLGNVALFSDSTVSLVLMGATGLAAVVALGLTMTTRQRQAVVKRRTKRSRRR